MTEGLPSQGMSLETANTASKPGKKSPPRDPTEANSHYLHLQVSNSSPETRNTAPGPRTLGKKRACRLASAESRLFDRAITKRRIPKNPHCEKKVRFSEPVILSIHDSKHINTPNTAVGQSALPCLPKRALYVVSSRWNKSSRVAPCYIVRVQRGRNDGLTL